MLGAALMALPLSAAAQVPEPPAAPESASGDLLGGYRAVETDSAPVLEARAVIQKELAVMRISQVDQAFAQVVAGMNYKLDCTVRRGDGEAATWEFIVWAKLDRTWELTSARKL
jgi:hypothetical protein